jgi:hypothetical protein
VLDCLRETRPVTRLTLNTVLHHLNHLPANALASTTVPLTFFDMKEGLKLFPSYLHKNTTLPLLRFGQVYFHIEALDEAPGSTGSPRLPAVDPSSATAVSAPSAPQPVAASTGAASNTTTMAAHRTLEHPAPRREHTSGSLVGMAALLKQARHPVVAALQSSPSPASDLSQSLREGADEAVNEVRPRDPFYE